MIMLRAAISIFCAVALSGLTAFAPANLRAQGAPVPANTKANAPDFSGVYYPIQQGRGGAGGGATAAVAAGQRGGPPATGQRATPPLPPTRSAPTGDLSNGRSPNAP